LTLEQDRQVSASLKGEAVDPKAIASVAEQLERMLHPARSDSPAAHEAADAEARAKLSRIIQGVLQYKENAAEREITPHDATVEWKVPARRPSEPPDATDAEVVADHPAPRPSPPVESDAQRIARINAGGSPSHYLKGADPAWKPFISESGDIRTGAGTIKSGADWSPPKTGW
jgi:hypothetical protein